MKRAYYIAEIKDFIVQSDNEILGELSRNNQFDLTDLQRNTWLQEIDILNRALQNWTAGTIIFEYTIPRIGSRVDVVLLINSAAYLIEFKCGESSYQSYAIDQVMDYALDLKNFHKASHNIQLIPILVSTNAPNVNNSFDVYEDNIAKPILCNKTNLREELLKIPAVLSYFSIDAKEWINSQYMPTPTIIEAAQALYNKHDVKEISRSDASAENLSITSAAIDRIIEDSKINKKKSICFITGVPGAGKTLAGLNIACSRHKFEKEEHAVFLSGNGPLVDVLQEALARDDKDRNGIKKSDALRKSKSFIQIIHHFRDDAISTEKAPIEKVAIFDEAQRAWNKHQTSKFMQTKKGVPDFDMSEPEFLISIMDRHEDWAVIVCLVGGGQEINTGEAGIIEWFIALKEKYADWNVYLSNNIKDSEYHSSGNLVNKIQGINYKFVGGLHLGVSLRSFRSEKLAGFVKSLLDVDIEKAKEIYGEIKEHYPLVITRDLQKAKTWVKSKARGTERYGMTASSGAKRLRTDGIWVQSKVDAVNWFLNGKDDIRSSYFMEETATEFDIQGLELDYTVVAWDANYRFDGQNFTYHNFTGAKWQNVNSESDRKYLKNTYRVLLTRARQGLVIYLPKGDQGDLTRPPKYYDNTYRYLRNIGIESLDDSEIDLSYDQPINKESIVKPNKPIVDPPKNTKRQTINIVDDIVAINGNSMANKKVGKIAQEDLVKLLESNKVPGDVINHMQTLRYSEQCFGCKFAVLKRVDDKAQAKTLSFDANGYRRYYNFVIKIRSQYYLLTSQWYDYSKNKLIAFINRYQ